MFSSHCRTMAKVKLSGVLRVKRLGIVTLSVVAVALAGCSSGLLGGGSKGGPSAETTVPVGNELASAT